MIYWTKAFIFEKKFNREWPQFIALSSIYNPLCVYLCTTYFDLNLHFSKNSNLLLQDPSHQNHGQTLSISKVDAKRFSQV